MLVTPGSGVRLRGSCWRRDTSRSNITSPLTTYCSTLYPPSPLSGIEGHPCAQNAALGGHRLASHSAVYTWSSWRVCLQGGGLTVW